MIQCKHGENGYCIRPENDYCHPSECKGETEIKETCDHPMRLTRVLFTTATCETTVEVCAFCKVQVSEIKTEC
jgi:hypothetical protein